MLNILLVDVIVWNNRVLLQEGGEIGAMAANLVGLPFQNSLSLLLRFDEQLSRVDLVIAVLDAVLDCGINDLNPIFISIMRKVYLLNGFDQLVADVKMCGPVTATDIALLDSVGVEANTPLELRVGNSSCLKKRYCGQNINNWEPFLVSRIIWATRRSPYKLPRQF